MPPSWVTALHSWEAEDKANKAAKAPVGGGSSVTELMGTKTPAAGAGGAFPCAQYGAPSTSHCSSLQDLGDPARLQKICAN